MGRTLLVGLVALGAAAGDARAQRVPRAAASPAPPPARTPYPLAVTERPLLLPVEVLELGVELTHARAANDLAANATDALALRLRAPLGRVEVELSALVILGEDPPPAGESDHLHDLAATARYRLAADHTFGLALEGLGESWPGTLRGFYRRKLHLSPRAAVEGGAGILAGSLHRPQLIARALTVDADARVIAQLTDRVALDVHARFTWVSPIHDHPLAWYTRVTTGVSATVAIRRWLDVTATADAIETGSLRASELTVGLAARRLP